MKKLFFLLLILIFINSNNLFSSNNLDSTVAKTKFKRKPIAIIDFGNQIGTGDYPADRLKLALIIGSQLTPNFSLGLGSGINFYTDKLNGMVPIFAHLKLQSKKIKNSPFLALALGFTVNPMDSFSYLGYMINPTIGISFKITKNTYFHFGLGYAIQEQISEDDSYNYSNDSYVKRSDRYFEAFELNAGLSF